MVWERFAINTFLASSQSATSMYLFLLRWEWPIKSQCLIWSKIFAKLDGVLWHLFTLVELSLALKMSHWGDQVVGSIVDGGPMNLSQSSFLCVIRPMCPSFAKKICKHGGTIILRHRSKGFREENASFISLFSNYLGEDFPVLKDDQLARFSAPVFVSVVSLSLRSSLVSIVYRLEMLVFSLPEDCPNCKVASIAHQFKGQVPIGSNQNRSLSQFSFKCIKGFDTLFREEKLSLFFKQACSFMLCDLDFEPLSLSLSSLPSCDLVSLTNMLILLHYLESFKSEFAELSCLLKEQLLEPALNLIVHCCGLEFLSCFEGYDQKSFDEERGLN
ncbi:hypothetical protein Tco_0250996 [Tanacetum coccineum]